MTTETFKCPRGCCDIVIKPYIAADWSFDVGGPNRKSKAGVFIRDPQNGKILLIQSCGNLWGPPKGTLNYGESQRMCAIREVKEETGLTISDSDFSKATKIRKSAIYFYMELKECKVSVQEHIPNNDANGICWISPECLLECVERGSMTLTSHCKIVLDRFINVNCPDAGFIASKKK